MVQKKLNQVTSWSPKRERRGHVPTLTLWTPCYPELNHAQICHIAGSHLVPIQEIPQQIETLYPCQETVLICHHDIRSRQAGYYSGKCEIYSFD